MKVFVLSYFYDDGTYAGIIGVYDSDEKATNMRSLMKMTDYQDCTFVITSTEVD